MKWYQNRYYDSYQGITTHEPVLQLLKRYYVLIALSAGAVRGDRHCPLLHRANAFLLITIPCIHACGDRSQYGRRYAPVHPAGRYAGIVVQSVLTSSPGVSRTTIPHNS